MPEHELEHERFMAEMQDASVTACVATKCVRMPSHGRNVHAFSKVCSQERKFRHIHAHARGREHRESGENLRLRPLHLADMHAQIMALEAINWE